LLENPAFPLVNVNLPPEPRGVRWTSQAVASYDGRIVPGTDPMGRRHFWYTIVPIEGSAKGTDLWAMEHRLISMTPLVRDLTDHTALDRAPALPENAARPAVPTEGREPGERGERRSERAPSEEEPAPKMSPAELESD
jgi:5'-nucleotidase